MSYESTVLRSWYLLFHFGSHEEILADVGFSEEYLPPGCLDFPVATTSLLPEGAPSGRALDLGCAVGRSSFELSRDFDEVIGIDFSESFIEVAEAIRNGEEPAYERFGEMHLPTTLTAKRPALCRPDRIRFEQGDAMALREDLGSFDLVHAANLVCRLPEPTRFTRRLHSLVNTGGHLIIATPATWLDEFTPRENQPTGKTLDFLDAELSAGFDRISVTEIPFLIREHQRKLQLSTSQTSLWRRK
ncbi:MAG: putative 4-mercaptohistidine N1-methyltransferase [Verrucomicrobiota bacterium]